ncbi:hypothetical protein BK126_04490 [Paenibacillus sp. FSL H7-0326]|uniref:hypothetical protein n=1 Tax=Paenibacillus sp. FSL H7-0326 TaxID=1921144 RepID=UPI00096BDC2D|nr:hypothetical protein [Paenibacillus sp. FSL H7-0326]OMC71361.1 hypothetical protein BK126_04490 [Paenibacillus sp. FSL H7-0326]
MDESLKLARDKRIKKELTRIKKSLKEVPKDKLTAAEGLIHRAAFLRIELEDLEEDINCHGSTELFQNGPDALPITRVRASAQQHNNVIRNYTTVCRNLADLIPNVPQTPKGKPEPDAFQKILARVK